MDPILDELAIKEFFSYITTGEEVAKKKPDPEIYLLTEGKLEIPSEDILVFENSKSGLEAAKKAGMSVFGIYRDSEHKETLSEADALIADFDDATDDFITASLNQKTP